jgi:hypothetical protein
MLQSYLKEYDGACDALSCAQANRPVRARHSTGEVRRLRRAGSRTVNRLCRHRRVADADRRDVQPPRRIRLRYAGTCRECGTSMPAGTSAMYFSDARQIACASCLPADADADVPRPRTPDVSAGADDARVQAGSAGSSARREYERRVATREQRIRHAHPRLAGFLLAISNEPRSTEAWQRGATGEERSGHCSAERSPPPGYTSYGQGLVRAPGRRLDGVRERRLRSINAHVRKRSVRDAASKVRDASATAEETTPCAHVGAGGRVIPPDESPPNVTASPPRTRSTTSRPRFVR